jgi:hypothetical protein
VVNPPEVAAPAKPMSFSCQYAAPAPDTWRGRNRPVTVNRTSRLLSRSRIWITAPGRTCSRAAAVTGSAAGIGSPARGWPGQCPVTRAAWAVMLVNAAASAIGTSLPVVLSLPFPEPALPEPALAGRPGPAPPGWPGRAPATKPRGSERTALSKRNGTCPRARLSWAGSPWVT